MASVPHCSAHPRLPALARCQRCNAALCNDCFRLYANGAPCCDACAVELASGPATRWPFAIAFAGFAVAICFAGARIEGTRPSWEVWGPALVIACIIAVFIGVTGPSAASARAATLTEREPELEPSDALLHRAAHPYRTRIARVARRIVPLSGRSTALVMTAALVVSAVVLPLGLRLPHWIEAELVLGVWWLGIGTLLTTLLFTGRRLAADHRFELHAPSLGGNAGKPGAKSGWSDHGGCGNAGCVDAGGCGEAALIVVVLAVAALAAWLVVEIVLPVVVFVVYYFAIKAIGRVARDRHDCEKNLGRSLGWGFFWASVYLVPVAALIAVIGTLIRIRAVH
ncbi:MAG: hypothetical protein IT377_02170 [Polyangiaceae bacterium]|nr:hypothetical protein [Polyangiaceae bacterium]